MQKLPVPDFLLSVQGISIPSDLFSKKIFAYAIGIGVCARIDITAIANKIITIVITAIMIFFFMDLTSPSLFKYLLQYMDQFLNNNRFR